jgi:hypothetical protein
MDMPPEAVLVALEGYIMTASRCPLEAYSYARCPLGLATGPEALPSRQPSLELESMVMMES